MANKKKVRILSLDGGGIRGIIPAVVVKYVESYLREKRPGTTIADHFDMIAGTSTGGILAGIYLAPDESDPNKARFSATEALNFYVEYGYQIFNASRLSNWQKLWGLRNATEYSPKYLEGLLKEKFGDLKMGDLRRHCLITTYNMKTRSSYFFTSLEDKTKRDFLVRDVLRSTSAAPTYFPPARVQNHAPQAGQGGEVDEMINIDGGVFANNPMMCAYAEARHTNFPERDNSKPTASHMYVLSIGTGGGNFRLTKMEKSNRWNLLKWAKSMPNIMMDGSVDTVAFQVDEIYKTLRPEDPGSHFRADAPKDARDYDADMSNASAENIQKLLKAGEKTLEAAKVKGLNGFLDGLLE